MFGVKALSLGLRVLGLGFGVFGLGIQGLGARNRVQDGMPLVVPVLQSPKPYASDRKTGS